MNVFWILVATCNAVAVYQFNPTLSTTDQINMEVLTKAWNPWSGFATRGRRGKMHGQLGGDYERCHRIQVGLYEICSKPKAPVSAVTAQIADWLIQSNNRDNVEKAKMLLKIMSSTKPPRKATTKRQSRFQKQRLQRYLTSARLARSTKQ